jgi:hypothetical protein
MGSRSGTSQREQVVLGDAPEGGVACSKSARACFHACTATSACLTRCAPLSEDAGQRAKRGGATGMLGSRAQLARQQVGCVRPEEGERGAAGPQRMWHM